MEKGIADYLVGDSFTGFMLVKNSVQSTAKNGKDYLRVTISDATGEVTSMIWDADEDKIEVFTTGNIIKIQGVVGEYQGNKQLNVQQFRLSTDEDEVDLNTLLETAPIDGDTLFTNIVDEVNSMENEKIKKLTLELLNKFESDFKEFPAAKSVHHSYVSGLAYHTYSMMNIAKAICELYPTLNKDLLIAGVVVHDIGKVIEYTGYVATEVTLEGKLKGHISIMNEEIGHIAKELGIEGEEVLLLQHMTLSHHGLQQNGWGSAVSPLIIEANVLHQIDMMDASLDAYKNAVKDTGKGEFTERIFGLDNRSFYNPTI